MTNSFLSILSNACADGNAINSNDKGATARDNFAAALRIQINVLNDVYEYGFNQGIKLAKEGSTKRFLPWFRRNDCGSYEMRFVYATYSFDLLTGDFKGSYTVLGDGSINSLIEWCEQIHAGAMRGDLDEILEKARCGQIEMVRKGREAKKAQKAADQGAILMIEHKAA
ncbi:hypothetical protein Gdia_0553 [Gluconacetobacter diazotrophicus PA1 5]|uniref:hypothetical protein n=1 Tax=Gluconacetobacter diazotrophicus TaxID=33996 RepID=UPI000181EFAD|nr:hypothetical protein [Gluconacetobacter diazotrophicus]ACI50347.1 hypothetical protein Gdia_0553 [Gluconacetobacter diazotrophicus PA1 5]